MKTRVISAFIAIIIIFPLIFMGGPSFYLGTGIVGLIGFGELINLRKTKRETPLFTRLVAVFSFLCLALSNLSSNALDFTVDYKIITMIIFLNLLPLVFYHNTEKYNIEDALFNIGSVFFLGLGFNFLITIRNYDLDYLIFLLLLTIFTDTFAYITGLLIGKHKMVPTISPNKTWEGFLGGTILGVFISSVFYISAFNYTGNIFLLISIVTFLCLIGQLGDLVFSSIKRYYDKKDFSNIMPGHGGILDRLDSILFVLLAFSFVVSFI